MSSFRFNSIKQSDAEKLLILLEENRKLKSEITEVKVRLEVAEKFLKSGAQYGLGVQQARKYFGQEMKWPEYEDPPGYEEMEWREK
jgi:hypothetical protein